MIGLPLIAQARADLDLVGWRMTVLLALAEQLLDVRDYRRLKAESVVHLCGCSKGTAVDALATLTRRGYLDRHDTPDGPTYRLCWTRAGRPGDRPHASAPASTGP